MTGVIIFKAPGELAEDGTQPVGLGERIDSFHDLMNLLRIVGLALMGKALPEFGREFEVGVVGDFSNPGSTHEGVGRTIKRGVDFQRIEEARKEVEFLEILVRLIRVYNAVPVFITPASRPYPDGLCTICHLEESLVKSSKTYKQAYDQLHIDLPRSEIL